MMTFKIEGDYIELNKLLKATGIAENGAAAGFAIASGKVKVDGAEERRKRRKIRPGQEISFSGRTIKTE